MKRLILTSICALSAVSGAMAQVQPNNPMEGYTPSNITSDQLDKVWSEMRTDLKGKDCYRRAQLWTYDMFERDRIYSRKIFIHYTNKWNDELDDLGREEGLSWTQRKTIKIEGIPDAIIDTIRANPVWDYHVAPLLKVDGKDVVVDRYLKLPYKAKHPYTLEQATEYKNLTAQPATPEEWVEALTVRGELSWEARRQELINEMNEYREKFYRATSDKRKAKFGELLAKAKNTYRKLDMDKIPLNERIDIKCRKITSMVELDKNQKDAWCFWSEVPMYYYNELDLRALAYGIQRDERGRPLNYAWSVPEEYHTEENFLAGREYIQTEFNEKEIEDAQGEIKSGSEEQKRREEEEERQKKLKKEEEKRQREAKKAEEKRLRDAKKAEENRKKEEEKKRKRAEREARRASRN